jgi:hypothetical protein
MRDGAGAPPYSLHLWGSESPHSGGGATGEVPAGRKGAAEPEADTRQPGEEVVLKS